MKKVLTALIIASTLISTGAAEGPQIEQRLADYDPLPAEAGEYVDTFIKVENTGNQEAEDVRCEAVPKHPFTLEDNQPTTYLTGDRPEAREIGRIDSHGTHLLQYRFKVDSNAVEGYNSFETRCKVGDTWIYETHQVNVVEGVKFSVNQAETVEKRLEPDTENVKIEASIANTGGSDADLVTADLKLPEGFKASESYSARDTAGKIGSGDTAILEFQIDVGDVEPGLHNAELEVNHDSETSASVQTLQLPVEVQEAPEFEFGEIPDLNADSKSSLSIDVENTGEEAESVSVYLQESSDQPVEFTDNHAYLGDLEQDGSATANFEAETDARPGTYSVGVEFRYTEDGNVVTEEESIDLQIKEGSAAPTSLIAVGLIALAAAAAFILRQGYSSKILTNFRDGK